MITTLKVVDVLLIAVVIGSIDVAVKVWKVRRLEMSSTETKRLAEYNAQVRLVKCLNSVETFVEQAKATRRMNALKKELLALAGDDCLDMGYILRRWDCCVECICCKRLTRGALIRWSIDREAPS